MLKRVNHKYYRADNTTVSYFIVNHKELNEGRLTWILMLYTYKYNSIGIHTHAPNKDLLENYLLQQVQIGFGKNKSKSLRMIQKENRVYLEASINGLVRALIGNFNLTHLTENKIRLAFRTSL